MTKKERVRLILSELEKLFPNAKIMLHFSSPWELLVAVMLSAQCTDKQVNKATSSLFKKYKTLDSYVHADRKEFEHDIYTTGFFRMKAKHILETARLIQTKYNSTVPHSMKEMISLPGVGRKTANVVLGNAYGIVEGIAVDTHVRRLSRALKLTSHTDPDKIERDLMRILPKEKWLSFTYLLIEYGRMYCTARKHDHANCPLTKVLQ
jgi:endonuclease-3